MVYKIGMVLEGRITGIQPYGAFVSLKDQQQGLIHISEIFHGYIKDINEVLSVGDKVTVKIIDIDEYTKKISLSLRAMQENQIVPGRKKKIYFTNRKKKIGFETLEKAMPEWIEESIEYLQM